MSVFIGNMVGSTLCMSMRANMFAPTDVIYYSIRTNCYMHLFYTLIVAMFIIFIAFITAGDLRWEVLYGAEKRRLPEIGTCYLKYQYYECALSATNLG